MMAGSSSAARRHRARPMYISVASGKWCAWRSMHDRGSKQTPSAFATASGNSSPVNSSQRIKIVLLFEIDQNYLPKIMAEIGRFFKKKLEEFASNLWATHGRFWHQY